MHGHKWVFAHYGYRKCIVRKCETVLCFNLRKCLRFGSRFPDTEIFFYFRVAKLIQKSHRQIGSGVPRGGWFEDGAQRRRRRLEKLLRGGGVRHRLPQINWPSETAINGPLALIAGPTSPSSPSRQLKVQNVIVKSWAPEMHRKGHALTRKNYQPLIFAFGYYF